MEKVTQTNHEKDHGKKERPADPASPKWHPGIKKRGPIGGETAKSPILNGHVSQKEEKDRKVYLEEQLSIEVQTGSVYTYGVVIFENGLEFSPCEKKHRDSPTQILEHYAYVSFDRLSNYDITSKLKVLSGEHTLLEKIRLIGELREENYKGGNGRMVYLNENGEIRASPPSKGPPIIVPKYIDVDGDIVHTDSSQRRYFKG